MKKGFKIILFIFLIIVFIFIPFYFTFNLVNPHLTVKMLGFKSYTILSDSMKPILNVGDIVIATRKDIADVEVGDIIAFNTKDDYVVTHMVAKKYNNDAGKILLRTKPNNLEADVDVDSDMLDKWVISESDYIGVINTRIPKLRSCYIIFPKQNRNVYIIFNFCINNIIKIYN